MLDTMARQREFSDYAHVAALDPAVGTLSIGITLRPTEPSVPSTPDWRLAAVICSQT
jgi:hypothetical protein